MDKFKIGLICIFLLGLAFTPISSNAMSLFSFKKRKTSEDGVASSSDNPSPVVRKTAGLFSKKRTRPRTIQKPSKRAGKKDFMALPQNFKKYNDPLTPQDLKDIQYVVSSCANKSSLSIAMSRSEIMTALGRVQVVHPFNFLETIQSDPKLKTDFRQMQSRGWVWNIFVTRLKEILTHLKSKGLILDKDIESFAAVTGIEKEEMASLIHEEKWDDLLNLYLESTF